MKENKAIGIIALHHGEYYMPRTIKEAFAALKEIQEYREIGTVEECREAVDKQKPKKPKKVPNSGVRYTDEYICPNCERHFTGTGIADYCYHCGQAIRWEESEEE